MGSFHLPTISLVRVSSSSPLPKITLRAKPWIPFLSCPMVCQNFLEANWKSFSVVSRNSSNVWIFAFATTAATAILACSHLTKGWPWVNHARKAFFLSLTAWVTTTGSQVITIKGTNDLLITISYSEFMWFKKKVKAACKVLYKKTDKAYKYLRFEI